MDILKDSGKKDKMVLKDETFKIIGACMAVHNQLGQGFKEKVYGDALEIEFKKQGIPYVREPVYKVYYDGVELQHDFQPDFVVYDKVVLEIKAVSEMDDGNKEQCINYMYAAKKLVGLLVNFRCSSIQKERFVNFDLLNKQIC